VVNETSGSSVLGEVRKVGKAVGACTYYNLEELEAVVRAAEAPRAPTIVLVSPSSFGGTGGERLVRGFKAAVARASANILIQLDHVSDLSSVERAVRCGVDAVMAEGSKLSFRDNLASIHAAASIPVPRQVLSVSWHNATPLPSRSQTAALVAVV
jgi:tagatose 1,6-diphosphate aldolase GatY/KbaY